MSTTKAPQVTAAQKQNAQKKQAQPPAPAAQQSQQQSQQVRDIEQENRNKQLYHEIVEEEKKVFGKKYPLRSKEPSMFDMLKWEAPLQQKCDFKSDHLPDAQIDQYKQLINKSADPFQTEQRDNYRQFYADKDTHVLIPDVEPEVIGQLKGHRIAQARPGTATIPAQESIPNEGSQVRGVKSSYQREFGRANINNAGELAEIVQHNHANRQTSSQALLEQAQKKKRVTTEPNKLYEEEEIIPVNPETEEDEEEQNGSQDGNKENGGKNSKAKQQQQSRGDPKIKSFKGVETKNVKSKLIKYKPQAVKLDPAYQQERILRRKERIGQMEETTRWLPNSAFTTYFGKPAFENYGRGNVNPSIGGCVYGQYLLSHNVNPHRGIHQPQFIQSYNNALNFGERLPESEPQPPRNVKEDFRLSQVKNYNSKETKQLMELFNNCALIVLKTLKLCQNQVEELKGRIPLTATKNKRDNLVIKKPDLINSLRFASNENSPVNAAKNEEEKRKRIQNSLKELKEGTKAHTAQRTNQSFTQFADQQQQQQQPQSADLQRPQSAAPARKSVKIADNASEDLTEEQILANQQWAADLPRNKFIDEMNRKKAKKNRITLKVTEVIPVLPSSGSKSNKGIIAGISSEKKNSLSPSRISLNSPQYQVPQIPTDQLGAEAQLNLADKLHNPKLYKNAPSEFTRYIPFAGKGSHAHDDIKSVFHYENIEDSDDEEF